MRDYLIALQCHPVFPEVISAGEIPVSSQGSTQVLGSHPSSSYKAGEALCPPVSAMQTVSLCSWDGATVTPEREIPAVKQAEVIAHRMGLREGPEAQLP